MEEFCREKGEIWKEVLEMVKPWHGQDTGFEILAVMKVVGIPIRLRDGAVFDKVGRLFGKVVWPSEFSWMETDNSVGFTYVITELCSRIDEEIVVEWKENTYKVWVVEEVTSWVPDFEIPETVNKDESMEEGEFRVDPGEIPNNGGGGLTSREDNGTQHGGSQNQSGENNCPEVEEFGVASQNGLRTSGPGVFEMGHSNITKSRKRARVSSPSAYMEELERISQRIIPTPLPNFVLPDLNKVSSNGNDSVENSEVRQDQGLATSDGTPKAGDNSMGHGDEDVDVQEAAILVNKEVDATVQVGAVVGMELNNFEGLVAAEIIGEATENVQI